MSSPSAGPPSADVTSLCRLAQTPGIQKPQLQTICVVNSLAKTGNKAELQRRIVNRKSSGCRARTFLSRLLTRHSIVIQECEQRRDLQRFNEVKQSIYNNAGVHARDHQPIPNHHPHSPYSPTTAAGQAAYTNMAPISAYAPPNGYSAANGGRVAIVQQSMCDIRQHLSHLGSLC